MSNTQETFSTRTFSSELGSDEQHPLKDRSHALRMQSRALRDSMIRDDAYLNELNYRVTVNEVERESQE